EPEVQDGKERQHGEREDRVVVDLSRRKRRVDERAEYGDGDAPADEGVPEQDEGPGCEQPRDRCHGLAQGQAHQMKYAVDPRTRRSLASSRRVTLVEGGLLVVGFVVLFVLLPHQLMGDDFTRFSDVERLIHHGELSDSRFSLVMPLFSVPVLLIGEVLRTPEWW